MALILIIEPDRTLGKIYRQALEADGHKVSLCQNAQSAINAVDENPPRLIILELELATHNGIEFLYELRSYSEWQTIPVLILSHVTPARSARQPRAWGDLNIVGYMYKPTTKLSKLISKVNLILGDELAHE